MHRTIGDSYGTDAGKRIFRQENTPSWQATQVTYDSMNAIQEEVANVITAEGYALNAPSEAVSAMTQLNVAIDKKVSDEATARDAAILVKVPNVVTKTSVGGEVYESDQGSLTGVGAFHANLQRLSTPGMAWANLTFRFNVDDQDYKWVYWVLPAAWRPSALAPQTNVVVPAAAVLYDDSETPQESAQIPMYASVQRISTPSTRDIIMFGGAEMMQEIQNPFPTQVAFPKPVAADSNDVWYVSCNIMYRLFA